MTNLTLFDNHAWKRPRLHQMHVVDAGPNDCVDDRGPHLVRFACGKCEFETGWLGVQSITEGRKGKPCPHCNKSLFIPLKAKWFEQFARGEKDTEYRPHGPRWNERTCFEGRPVVLSRGYGKQQRLYGYVERFTVTTLAESIEGWRDCYPDNDGPAACITIKLYQEERSCQT